MDVRLGSLTRGKVTGATLCAAISPYLAYWLYLKMPRLAAKRLAIGIGLYASAVFAVLTVGILLQGGAAEGRQIQFSAALSMYANIAGFIVEELWDIYLFQDVRKRIKRKKLKESRQDAGILSE